MLSFSLMVLLLSQFISSVCLQPKNSAAPECKKAANVIIVLDASGSVKKQWQKQTSFAGRLANAFEFGPQKSHLGIIYFSSQSVVHLNLNKQEMNNRDIEKEFGELREVEKFISSANITSTHLALEDAIEMYKAVSNERRNISNVLIVFTDGDSTYESSYLDEPIKSLKKLNVVTITIGITLERLGEKRRNKAFKELDAMSSSLAGKKLIYDLRTFHILLDDVSDFLETLCPVPECKKAVNVIIVLDASGSVKRQWQKQISFAGNLTKDFEFGPKKSHLGIIYFSSQSVVHLNLNKHGMNNRQIEKKLRELRDVDKSISHANYTSTHLALEDAIEMFKAISIERRNISNVLVVVTDGDSTYKSSYLVDPIKSLEKLNVVRITIGVGLEQLGERRRNKALTELNAMASSLAGKKLTYDIRTFDILLEDVNQFIEAVCSVPGKINQCGAVDIVFILDSSWSIADYYFNDEIQFALNLGFGLEPINSERTRIGVIRFATRADTIIDINEFGHSSQHIKKTLGQKIVQSDLGSQTHTEKALSNAVYMFRAVRRDRTVPKVLVILTDGCSTNGVEAMESQISSLKNDKVTIVAIGIDLINNLYPKEMLKATKELEHMSSSHPVSGEKLHYDIKNVDQVFKVIRSLINVKCNLKKTTSLL